MYMYMYSVHHNILMIINRNSLEYNVHGVLIWNKKDNWWLMKHTQTCK